MSEICGHIEAYYLHLKAGRSAFVRNTYISRLYLLNEEQNYRSNGQVFKGFIKHVTDEGMLIIDKGGEEAAFNFKEIEFLNQ